jgi:hypothetical protein
VVSTCLPTEAVPDVEAPLREDENVYFLQPRRHHRAFEDVTLGTGRIKSSQKTAYVHPEVTSKGYHGRVNTVTRLRKVRWLTSPYSSSW